MKTSTTVCLIVKNEERYVLEWVLYHRLIGFDNIVVYSNDCSDGSIGLLDRLERRGLLVHHIWPSSDMQSPQLSAYADAISRCKTEWIGFLDADEFFNPLEVETVGSFLERFSSDVAAIAINWRIFGSSGKEFYQPGLVLERFRMASRSDCPINRHVKTIARCRNLNEMHIHRAFLLRGRYVDTAGQEIEIEQLGLTSQIRHKEAQINHYIVKSYEEFQDKRLRGNANRPANGIDKYTSRDGDYYNHHDRNEELDETIQRFVLTLKSSLLQLRY